MPFFSLGIDVTGLTIRRHLGITQIQLSRTLQRVTTGWRINEAADDPSGLAVQQKFAAQIRGLQQASRNAQDGISLVQTAENGLSEIQSIVQRLRELAVQAANDSLTVSDRQNVQQEADGLLAEIDRIAETTEFNGRKVLSADGAKIAFESVRDGNGEIYVMNPDGSQQTNLTHNGASDENPAWSPDGTKIAFPSNRNGNYEIYTMNADGSYPVNLTANPAPDDDPAWSPDGTKIAFHTERDGNAEIYLMDADGSNPVNLTQAASGEASPSWSPDGTRIAFYSDRVVGNGEIFVMDADGSNPVNLTNDPEYDYNPAWSPDGTRITFFSRRDGNMEIYAMNSDGSNPVNLTNNPADDRYSAWSPDGTKIAFQSNRDGNWEIYVMNADGSNPVNLTNNTAADVSPAWSPGSPFILQIGPNVGQIKQLTFNVTAAAGLGISEMDLTTHSGASSALSSLDSANETLSTRRARLGAAQNQLEYVLSNVESELQSHRGSVSRIEDVDVAMEAIELARLQIMQQSGAKALLSANVNRQAAAEQLLRPFI